MTRHDKRMTPAEARVRAPLESKREQQIRDLPTLIRRHSWTAAEDAADAITDLLAELDRLRDEVVAWREGSTGKLEQLTGQRVVLMLAPKDLCRFPLTGLGLECELRQHAEETLHRAPYGNGYAEWSSGYGNAAGAQS